MTTKLKNKYTDIDELIYRHRSADNFCERSEIESEIIHKFEPLIKSLTNRYYDFKPHQSLLETQQALRLKLVELIRNYNCSSGVYFTYYVKYYLSKYYMTASYKDNKYYDNTTVFIYDGNKISDDLSLDNLLERDTLRKFIRELPAKKRRAIFWFYYNGMSLTEIARIQNITPAGAKKQIDSGVNELRNNYVED